GDDTTELKAYQRALKSNVTTERVKAAQDIGKLGPAAILAVPDLCEAAVDPSSKVSVAALEALGQVNPKLHKQITTLLVDKEPQKRTEAMQELAALENLEDIAPILIAHIRMRLPREEDFFGATGDISGAIEALIKTSAKNPTFLKVLMEGAGP